MTLADGSGDVAVVEVLPSDMPPVRYDGRIHIRVGPRRALASEQEERLLAERRTALARSFDVRPCRGATMADLVRDLFVVDYRPQAVARGVIDENRRSLREQLASLRFWDLEHDCPTHAGVLVSGREPRRWLPGAYVQFVELAGPRLGDEVALEKEISGDLLAVLRALDLLVKVQVRRRPVARSALREASELDYPVAALRELLLNAVMHRLYETNAPVRFYWFADRVEIQNPGGLYGLATPENFPRQNDYRNPTIAEAMKVLGYVNRYGRGVARARGALADNRNPAPEFQFEPTHVVATVRRRA